MPDPTDIRLDNDAVQIDGTVLYADLAESTSMVMSYRPSVAAEIYKMYLDCTARVIRHRGGIITAYDGDRIMAVFAGDNKESRAACAGLHIHYCMLNIINPILRSKYVDITQPIRQSVGIDTGQLFVARIGIRGSNDLVWVGRPANYAAKLSAVRNGDYGTWITGDVYERLSSDLRWSHQYQRTLWEPWRWHTYEIDVYASMWWWRP